MLARHDRLVAQLFVDKFAGAVFLQRRQPHGEGGVPHTGYHVQRARRDLRREVFDHQGAAQHAGLLGVVFGEVDTVRTQAAHDLFVVDGGFGPDHIRVVFHFFRNRVQVHIGELPHQIIAQQDSQLLIFNPVYFVTLARNKSVDVIIFVLCLVNKIVGTLHGTGPGLGTLDFVDNVRDNMVILARLAAIIGFQRAHVLDLVCTEHNEGAT